MQTKALVSRMEIHRQVRAVLHERLRAQHQGRGSIAPGAVVWFRIKGSV